MEARKWQFGRTDRQERSPRHYRKSPMSTVQVLIVGITVALNALDGFDVASISFASPGIAKEWGIDRGALGVVLSMEVIGMAIGSMLLGGVADKIGRRRTVLAAPRSMALGCSRDDTRPGGAVHLARLYGAWHRRHARVNQRRFRGVFNTKRRDLSVSLMSIGYPIGVCRRDYCAPPAGDIRLAFGGLLSGARTSL